MIYHVTTATVNTGKLALMGAWANKVTAQIKESHGVEVTVLRNVAGSGDEWHFMTTHDSMAVMEGYLTTVSADPKFQAMAAEVSRPPENAMPTF